VIVFGFPGHPSLKKGGESLTYRYLVHLGREVRSIIFVQVYLLEVTKCGFKVDIEL